MTDERQDFERLQQRLAPHFRAVFDDPLAPRTVVVVPSMSLDPTVLAQVAGAQHYEERMLGMLMLLRMPATRVVFVTSEPIAPVIVDYYLSLLSGVPFGHARERLTLLAAHDASPEPLTRKLLARPRLLGRIRAAIGDPASAHLSVFQAGDEEVSLAVALGIPMYGCDPALQYWGGKSGSRRVFREAGVPLPDGAEDLRDFTDAAEAIQALRTRSPGLGRVVLKVDQGFSGEGNAVLDLAALPARAPVAAIADALRRDLQPEAERLDAASFAALYEAQGGIVEAWIDGPAGRSPSAQVRINPLGDVELISTHEQVMGGRTGQVFLGSSFPADAAYAQQLHAMAGRVGQALQDRGVLGRFAIDFVSAPEAAAPGGWRHHAIEINLRKGGTTLPYQMLQFLTNGRYDASRAQFLTPMDQPRCYVSTDNLVNPDYRRLVPQDLIDILVAERLQFDETVQQGLVFSLIGALAAYGKLGLISIARTVEDAQAQFDRARALLDREAAR